MVIANRIEGHSALVSNTLVCEVGRLLSDKSKNRRHRSFYARRHTAKNSYADLNSLIEAIILHDNICTLPARIDEDDRSVDLRQKLIGADVLTELDTQTSHDKIGSLILNNLGQIDKPLALAGSASHMGSEIDFDRRVKRSLKDYFLLDENPRSYQTPKINDTIDYFDGDTSVTSTLQCRIG